MTESYHAAW